MLATRLPLNLGSIHFIGIGGIGMSGIAEVLVNLGTKIDKNLSNSRHSYATNSYKMY